MEMCRRDVVRWFNNWVWTYDPKAIAEGRPSYVPMDLFPRQIENLRWIDARFSASEDGLEEKSRDVGATWLFGGWAFHKWLFIDGFKASFCSRVGDLVDTIGQPDSIFEKIRLLYRNLPNWMLPQGFRPGSHDLHLLMTNPANGAIISGESAANAGRGGRSSVYIIDEAAHVENGDAVDASTSGTSDCRFWVSSVHGMANTFAKKRHGGSLKPHQIFRLHWSDDPRKTPEWAAKKRGQMEAHNWAAEYDIDYSASVEGICIPAKWVQAAIALGKKLDVVPSTTGCAGLDVGGGGKGKSVFIARFGPVVRPPISWGEGDTTATAIKGLDLAEAAAFNRKQDGRRCTVKRLCYDNIGVGKGVQSTLKNHGREGLSTSPVNVGLPPSKTKWPDGDTSEQKYANLKAELWWMARARFKASYELWLFLQGEPDGQEHPISDCIILPGAEMGPDCQSLISQLSLPKTTSNEKGKTLMESKVDLARRGIASPDHAEALILSFAEKIVAPSAQITAEMVMRAAAEI